MTGCGFPCGWIRHSRAGGNLELSAQKLIGKNGFFRFYVLDSHFRGNDGGGVAVFPINARNLKSRHSSKTKNQKQKFRHSRAGGNPELSARKLIGKNGFFRFYVLDSHFRGNDGGGVAVFPINARNLKSRHSPKTKNQKQKSRHSRAGGNLELSVRKLIR